jgi:hypothetical protein
MGQKSTVVRSSPPARTPAITGGASIEKRTALGGWTRSMRRGTGIAPLGIIRPLHQLMGDRLLS